jgi:hypothetical protein
MPTLVPGTNAGDHETSNFRPWLLSRNGVEKGNPMSITTTQTEQFTAALDYAALPNRRVTA